MKLKMHLKIIKPYGITDKPHFMSKTFEEDYLTNVDNNSYQLYAYNKKDDIWYFQRRENKLSVLKNYVLISRNNGELLMPLYIKKGNRLVKRYNSLLDE